MWHRERAKAMIKAHPEIKNLFGNDPTTALWCLAAAGSQIALALAASFGPWWLTLLLAYAIGSSINIMLFQLGHECVHGLVFKRPFWESRVVHDHDAADVSVGTSHVVAGASGASHRHGAKKDFITRRRTFFLATRPTSPLFLPYSLLMLITQVVRSTVGLVMYLFGSLLRGRLKPGLAHWLCFLTSIWFPATNEKDSPLGPWGIRSSIWRCVESCLPWVAGSRLSICWPARRFLRGLCTRIASGGCWGFRISTGRGVSATASHYGWFVNLVSFNAGLHVEHHDLMTIPWRRLPQLRRIASEFYDDLATIPSYTGWLCSLCLLDRDIFEQNFNHEAHRNAARFQASAGESAEASTVNQASTVS